MKILLVGFTKMKYMPYARFYLDNIDRSQHEVHILLWNRDLQDEDLSAYDMVHFHEFRYYQEDDVPKATKLIGFLKYRRFAKKLLSEERFSLLIIMHTLPGVLLLNEVTGTHHIPFILDYRDSTYEGFRPFQLAVNKLAINSEATFVSSDGFRRFLPCDDCDVHTVHNIAYNPSCLRSSALRTSDFEPIKIGFWGFIRHEELNRAIIDAIGQDARFELHYYGREQQIALNLKEYAMSHSYQNVVFHGEYDPEDRIEFSKDIDLVHNMYKDRNMLLAMGNKYYDGLMFQIPQLFMEGSQMAAMGCHAGIGMACDPYAEVFLDEAYQYYKSIDWQLFANSCGRELERVLQEQDLSIHALARAIDLNNNPEIYS